VEQHGVLVAFRNLRASGRLLASDNLQISKSRPYTRGTNTVESHFSTTNQHVSNRRKTQREHTGLHDQFIVLEMDIYSKGAQIHGLDCTRSRAHPYKHLPRPVSSRYFLGRSKTRASTSSWWFTNWDLSDRKFQPLDGRRLLSTCTQLQFVCWNRLDSSLILAATGTLRCMSFGICPKGEERF